MHNAERVVLQRLGGRSAADSHMRGENSLGGRRPTVGRYTPAFLGAPRHPMGGGHTLQLRHEVSIALQVDWRNRRETPQPKLGRPQGGRTTESAALLSPAARTDGTEGASGVKRHPTGAERTVGERTVCDRMRTIATAATSRLATIQLGTVTSRCLRSSDPSGSCCPHAPLSP